ncbi:MAG: hypothetical protein O2973_09350 [Gemmatimonadetes bacterium]|nr:hypothetical protein [Gemmatimonadota bacterium]
MTQNEIGSVPWQVTGNHWLALPCVHPVDGAVHAVGLLHRGARAAVEFAGSADFLEGTGAPLARPVLHVNGAPLELARQGIAWERGHHWIPTFTATAGDIVVRGTLFAPFGRDVDVPGAVYALSVENRGSAPADVIFGLEGTLGHRQLRVRTPRPIQAEHRATETSGGHVVLDGGDTPGFAALAIAGDDGATVAVTDSHYAIHRQVLVPAGQRAEAAFFIGAGPERDGALATVGVLKQRGWKALLQGTRDALRSLEQTSGFDSIDGVINRHLMFAYFYSVGRALDDAHFYVVRSRAPWSSRGVTIRDWEALMWTVPAVQLADPALARELILRICEVHGYAPGRGINYFDGTLFSPGFTLEGASAYAIAADRYIRDSGDDQIVEEPVLADTLYLSAEDLSDRRDEHHPLYHADVGLGGEPSELFSIHANAAVAFALDCLKRTLDEAEAKALQDPEAVRAAIRRHFSVGDSSKALFASSAEPGGRTIREDDAAASTLWLPLLEAVDRTDSVFRRTAKAVGDSPRLEQQLARLMGPDSGSVLEWLRRAPLDRGFAAEFVDEAGVATGGGGDAALSGLVAYVAWYAVHAFGVRP